MRINPGPAITALALALSLLSAGCRQAPETSGQASASAQRLETLSLTIHTETGDQQFEVEVARTPQQQEKGLMYRTELPKKGGMLFPSAQPEPRSFWMKNTVIPLDMIFIRPDRTIANIAANTVPNSLDPEVSVEPVIAVLEIAGGEAAALGIKPGDRVSWSDPAANAQE